MKELLAFGAVLVGFASLWAATYHAMKVDEPNIAKRHGLSAVVGLIGASLLWWLISPADGSTDIGWGWTFLACVIALALLAIAKVAPEAASDVLEKHARANTRAIHTGWTMGDVEFTYEDSAREITRRRVTVHSVTSTYLKGECHDRQAERTFRIDRIRGDIVDCNSGEILRPQDLVRKIRT